MATAEPITASLTRARLQADRCRLQAHLAQNAHAASLSLWLTPSYQAVYLHRWSHYHYLRGHRLLARALWHLNLLLTSADISPLTDIEGGLLIVHPLANIMLGRAGRNLTVMGHAGFGAASSEVDIGAGPGLPIIGNDVVIEFGACIQGPVRVSDGVRVGVRAIVTSNMSAGSCAESSPSRIVPRKLAAAIMLEESS